jgi:hypothetical protein
MTTSAKRQRRIAVDRAKVDFAKRYFGVTCDREAIDRALGLLMREERIVRRLKALGGALRGDKRTWPYS